MSRKKAPPVITPYNSNLEQPPHILPVVIDFLKGGGHLNPFEQEDIFTHLADCVPCQEAVRVFLVLELERDRQIGITEEPVRKLISRLSDIIEEIHVRQDIPAFVEAIELWGDEEARKKYPRLAEHLQNCTGCRSVITGVQNLKREAEESGMIAPLTDKGG